MRLKTVIAILLGCLIGFLIFGLLKGEYEWKYLIAALIGGPIGYLTVLAFVKNSRRKSTLG
jgi:TRAP-type mannitol/chloroaromatic compound transport system permease large subunit